MSCLLVNVLLRGNIKNIKMLLGLAISAMVLVDEGRSAGTGTFGSTCDENDSNSCDIQSQLSCSASLCDCLYPWMIYDRNRTKCVSPVNQPCDPDNSNQEFIDCVTHAECKFSLNEFRQLFPSCSCQQNYSPSFKSHCEDLEEQTRTYYRDQLPQICCPTSSS